MRTGQALFPRTKEPGSTAPISFPPRQPSMTTLESYLPLHTCSVALADLSDQPHFPTFATTTRRLLVSFYFSRIAQLTRLYWYSTRSFLLSPILSTRPTLLLWPYNPHITTMSDKEIKEGDQGKSLTQTLAREPRAACNPAIKRRAIIYATMPVISRSRVMLARQDVESLSVSKPMLTRAC
jgi:hypothetical protein